jgi:predicted transcriptional regulator
MRTGKSLTIFLPRELSERLEQSAKRNRRSKTMQVVIALEQFLEADEATATPAKPEKGKGGKDR